MRRHVGLALTLLVWAASVAPAQVEDELLGFTPDGRFYATRSIDYTMASAVGGESESTEVIELFDTASGASAEFFYLSKQFLSGDPELSAKQAQNRELRRAGEARLASLRLRPGGAIPVGLAVGVQLAREDGKPEPSDEEGRGRPAHYAAAFRLTHRATGAFIEIGKASIFIYPSYGPELTVVASPEGRTLVVSWIAHPVMEFEGGGAGTFAVIARDLAQLENAAGFAHYQKGAHSGALQLFERALVLDPGLEKAAYNAACMQALLGRVEDCITALKRLKSIGTAEALRLHGRVGADTDFDRVRVDGRFKTYLGT